MIQVVKGLKALCLAVADSAHSRAGPVWRRGLQRRHGDGEAGGAAEERSQHSARLGVSHRCQGTLIIGCK